MMQVTKRQDRSKKENQMPDFFDDRDDYESKWKTKRDYPYKQKKTKGGSLFGFAVAAFALIALGWMIVDAFQDYMKYILLVREGVPATAVITEKYTHEINRRAPRPDYKTYYIVYQYTALVNGSPASLESKVTVSRSRYSKYEVGQEIEVLYAASNPEISATKAGFGPPSIFSILLFAALATWLAYLGLKEMSKSFHVHSYG